MDIYLVRHGQTEYNKQRVHQPENATLTELGRAQAATVSQRLRELEPTELISSSFARARETANIINAELQLDRLESDLFVELRRPERMYGVRYLHPRSLWYTLRWFFGLKNERYTPEVGETRLAFLSRLLQAQKFLEGRDAGGRIVVVTHAIFIDFFVEHICRHEPIPFWKAILLLLKLRRLKNTSITHLRCHGPAQAGICRWELVSMGETKSPLQVERRSL